MPAEERITEAGFCELAERWQVEPATMERVWLSAGDFEQETGRHVYIISGFRTAAQQERLTKAGRPTAPPGRSTHTSCPATGVDVWLGPLPNVTLKHIWGRVAILNGLRWGGGSQVNPETGVPSDWPHVDRGPRAA